MAVGRASEAVAFAPAEPDRFADWIRPHWAVMHALAYRLSRPGSAEDVVQEALADAWRHRRRFDPARGEARSWLLTLVANRARRSYRGTILEPLHESDAPDADRDHDARIDLSAALVHLTERQRLAVSLHYYLGLPVGECAAVMGCAAGTVKSTLSDARNRLREWLGEDET